MLTAKLMEVEFTWILLKKYFSFKGLKYGLVSEGFPYAYLNMDRGNLSNRLKFGRNCLCLCWSPSLHRHSLDPRGPIDLDFFLGQVCAKLLVLGF